MCLLKEGHPRPETWAPLPPCKHVWFDITAIGDTGRREVCGKCDQQRYIP